MKRLILVLLLALAIGALGGDPKPHCWHSLWFTGHEYARWTTQTCCWCGRQRNVVFVDQRDPNHGPCYAARVSVASVVTELWGPGGSHFDEALPEPPAWCGSRS